MWNSCLAVSSLLDWKIPHVLLFLRRAPWIESGHLLSISFLILVLSPWLHNLWESVLYWMWRVNLIFLYLDAVTLSRVRVNGVFFHIRALVEERHNDKANTELEARFMSCDILGGAGSFRFWNFLCWVSYRIPGLWPGLREDLFILYFFTLRRELWRPFFH